MTELNNVIEEKLKIFIGVLSDASEDEKKFFHYNSVINVSKRIVSYNTRKAQKSKEKIIQYFNELEKMEYDLKEDKVLSSQLHNKYIHPVSLFLFKKENFISNADKSFMAVLGLTLDIILYWWISNYYFPIFMLGFLGFGIYRRRKAKRNGKYSGMFW